MAEPIIELDTILDICLAKIKTEGWSIEDCLAQYPVYRDALEGPLRIAAWLGNAQGIAPSLRFKENASRRLQARLQSSSRPPLRTTVSRTHARATSNRWLFPMLRRFTALLAVLGLIVALAAGTTGVAYAADGAVPGDSLYGIDRGVERLELSLTQDPNQALRRQVAFTDERLGEAEQLVEQGNAGYFEEAINNYDQSVLDITRLSGTTDEQTDESLSQLVDQTLSQHHARLEELLGKVPDRAKMGIERALEASSNGRDNALKALKERGNKHESEDGDDRPGNAPPDKDKTPKPPNNERGNGPPDGVPGNPPGKKK
jgi:hypothetical protein